MTSQAGQADRASVARFCGFVLREHDLTKTCRWSTVRGMAIFRRRRNGKFTGNWIARIDGKEVNLDTKDKLKARERAAAANIGEWPRNPDADARSVAAQVAAADDSAPDVMPSEVAPKGLPDQQCGEAAQGPKAPEPLPEGGSGAGVSAADVAAAAAEAVGTDPSPSIGPAASLDAAAEMGQELQREFFPAGIQQGDFGATMAALAMTLEYAVAERVANSRKTPKTIPEPDPQALMARVLACACRVLGRRWSGSLAVNPWVVVGVVLAAYPIQMALAARPLPPPQEPPANGVTAGAA
jgi:hypothetical protein